MTATPTAELVQHAAELGVVLTARGARKLRAERGEEAARERIACIAALLDLASALGHELTQLQATRRLDAAAGDYDQAAGQLLDIERARRQRVLNAAWERLEDALYARDAWSRHATVVSQSVGGTLGWRAMMLLAAARDAGLLAPDADAYRRELVRLVDAEVERRYPSRRETDWQVVDPDSNHASVLHSAIREEKQARELVLARRPELQQKLDALASDTLRRDVERLLNRIRRRLLSSLEQGWHPDPERYQREVAEAAAIESQRAA